MKAKANWRMVVTAVAALSLLCGSAVGLEVLEGGCVVDTYCSYPFEVSVAPCGMPRGMVFDHYGNLYLSQWISYPNNGVIYKVTPQRQAYEWVSGLGTPRRMVWAGGTEYGDYLYVADATPKDILKIDLDGNVSKFCHVNGGPHSLAMDVRGSYGERLHVATRCPDNMPVVSVDGKVQMFSNFPGSVPGGHADLTFDPGLRYGGYMYAVMEDGKTRRRGVYGVFAVDQKGNAQRFTSAIVSAYNVQIAPCGVFGGDMFVAGKTNFNQTGNSIWRVSPAGDVTEFAAATRDTDLLIFTFGPDGAIYVPEYSMRDKEVIVNRISEVGQLVER